MAFSVYLPPQARTERLPVLYYLSGLTCTEENFMTKAGAPQFAADLGIILVAPDTSPRNTGIPGEDDRYDLGSGAGFYVDATVEPWNQHYRTYSYIVDELPQLISMEFQVLEDRQSIFGHSMGGHGALVCALRNPERYWSVSAFAPICAPSRCPWGETAFTTYLGSDRQVWRTYDATELVKTSAWKLPILIDQGSADTFLEQQQLLPEVFQQACNERNIPLTLRFQEGYDHGYYFISTFIKDHLDFHAEALRSVNVH